MANKLSAGSIEYGLGVYDCRGPRALTHAGFIEMPEGEHWGWDQTILHLGILKEENYAKRRR
jgi:hypothetical protein